MKPLLTFLTLFLMFGGVASAKPINFKCESNSNGDQYLIINLEKKITYFNGREYEETYLTEEFLTSKLILDSATGESISITLNRFSGQLDVWFYKTKEFSSVDLIKSYKAFCKIIKKII
jgi:hypothetical protein